MFNFVLKYLNMNQFSISQLAQFSGIKPHTIRIWEQRYNALQPQRSEGNTRYYDGFQLRRLLNIVSLMKTEHKVSSLCSMPDEELFRLLEQHHEQAINETDYDYFVNQLISAGMNYDESNFEKIFSHCFLRFGMTKTYEAVIYPLLTRIGIMWTSNAIPPSQEHYISNLLRQKLFTAIDSLPLIMDDEDSWMLFLPEDEFHEIGLLFANYLIRSRDKRSLYLGPNVPLSSIENALKDTKVKNLLLFMVHRDLPENNREYLEELSRIGKGKNIYLAVNPELSEEIKTEYPLNWLFSVADLEKAFSETNSTKT